MSLGIVVSLIYGAIGVMILLSSRRLTTTGILKKEKDARKAEKMTAIVIKMYDNAMKAKKLYKDCTV